MDLRDGGLVDVAGGDRVADPLGLGVDQRLEQAGAVAVALGRLAGPVSAATSLAPPLLGLSPCAVAVPASASAPAATRPLVIRVRMSVSLKRRRRRPGREGGTGAGAASQGP